MEYTHSIPVKALFSVYSEKVKTFTDLIAFLNSKIDYIKELEAAGWKFDYEQSCDWLHFTHTNRSIALEELGEDGVYFEEENYLSCLKEEEEANIKN